MRVENGVLMRLQYHQARVYRALTEVHNSAHEIDLTRHFATVNLPAHGLYKCRVIYGHQINSVEFIPYAAKTIQKLKVVYDNTINYEHKYEDRTQLNKLFEQRMDCDDVLIVKNNFVTDSSLSNIIFFDGEQWVTPDTPLLKGTMRQILLDEGRIREARIAIGSINSFKKFKLINAMLGFEGPEIEVSGIVL